MREITLVSARRGMRAFLGGGVILGRGKPTRNESLGGTWGTILEVTTSCPGGVSLGRPGVLFHRDQTKAAKVLTRQQAEDTTVGWVGFRW